METSALDLRPFFFFLLGRTLRFLIESIELSSTKVLTGPRRVLVGLVWVGKAEPYRIYRVLESLGDSNEHHACISIVRQRITDSVIPYERS